MPQDDKKTRFPGIRIRSNSIQIDFRYRGVRCRETLTISPTPTNIQMAANLLGKIRHDIAFNDFNYMDYFPQSRFARLFGSILPINTTISDAIDWWWKTQKCHHRAKTIENYEKDIANHINPGIGHILLLEITPYQIKDWINEKDLSNSTKNNILIPLRKMFNEVYNNGFIEKNIMNRIPSFKIEKKRKEPFKPIEVDSILKALDEPFRSFYQFSFWTGLSTGEQIALKWKDIDFESCLFYVRRQMSGGKYLEETKNETRNRRVELIEPAYQAILAVAPEDLMQNRSKYDDEWIFKNPRTNDHWRIDALTNPWRKALKALKIKYRRPYNTRHTFASIMITACLPDGWIRHQMGHSTMRMLEEVYGRWMDDAGNVVAWVREKSQGGHNGPRFTEFFLNKQ